MSVMAKKKTPHDGSYRRLFSHARMIADLLERYVVPPWIGSLDLSTLELVPAHYVSDELEQRESDVVWRVRYGPDGEWFYVYVLIEFQSSVYRFMAVRLLAYVLLLYQDLIRNKRLTRAGLLPPVLPIVLYNGKRRWTAPTQMLKLVQPISGYESFIPSFEYFVIDEGGLPQESLEPLDSPVTGVFQLERSQSVEEIRRIVDTLIDVLDDPELREMRRDLAMWIRRAILPARLPGVELPELHDLQEAKMLAERAAKWPKEWMAEGYRKGILEGREKGILEGREKGILEGRERGILEGQRATLTELVEERFGSMEVGHRKRVERATKDQLKRWLREVLKASTADEVFQATSTS